MALRSDLALACARRRRDRRDQTDDTQRLRLGSEDQGGGDQARDAHEHPEQEGLEGAAAALAALGAHLVRAIARAGPQAAAERALALEQTLRQIIGRAVAD